MSQKQKYIFATTLAILFNFATLSQIILETVGGVIMVGNFISKTIIYKRILGKSSSLYLT